MLTSQEYQWFDTEVAGKGGRISLASGSDARDIVERLPVWGCLHCFAHLECDLDSGLSKGWQISAALRASQPDDAWKWFTLIQVCAHLKES